MAGKTVLVTGCSSGIGLCIAKTLKERGYNVAATARKEADVATLREAGFAAIRLDLADSASVKAAAQQALAAGGGEIYALVNNAAFGAPGAVEDLTREAIREQFETNLFGTMELTNQIIPSMRKAGGGRIVMISSILGVVAMKYQGAYNASKFALEGLSDTLSMELAGSGIRVCVIQPGPIRSRIRENALKFFSDHFDPEKSVHREKYMKMKEAIAAGKEAPFTGNPEDVAAKVIHALESASPRMRYRVTFIAHVLELLRRTLPYSVLYGMMGKK